MGRLLLKTLLSFLATLIGLVLFYILLAFLLAYIPVNAEANEPKEGVEIFITTNGVHADFTLPVQTPTVDWRDYFPLQDFPAASPHFQYVAFGWGDKGFYLNTPRWEDLTFSTAFKALLLPSPTALHVTYYRLAPSKKEDQRKVVLTEEQYRQLVAYILKSFKQNSAGMPVLLEGVGYTAYDNFYEAHGSYYFFYTCNNWVNEGLQEIGVKTALWAPFDWGVMYHLEE